MAIAQRYVAQQHVGRGGPSGLADVLEVLLDKGLVIDAYVRVSLVGIELLTVDARVVVASVDTYLRFAEAVNRLDLTQATNAETLGELVGNGSSPDRTRSSAGDGDQQAGDPDEREADDARDEGESARSAGETDADRSDEDADSGAGILSRIKQRGQVF